MSWSQKVVDKLRKNRTDNQNASSLNRNMISNSRISSYVIAKYLDVTSCFTRSAIRHSASASPRPPVRVRQSAFYPQPSCLRAGQFVIWRPSFLVRYSASASPRPRVRVRQSESASPSPRPPVRVRESASASPRPPVRVRVLSTPLINSYQNKYSCRI